jgi:hypothetical protein
MSGDGAPGGLPLIFRFSRVSPVNLPVRGGTLDLVNRVHNTVHALASLLNWALHLQNKV